MLLPRLLRGAGLVRGEAGGCDLLVEVPDVVVLNPEPGHQLLWVRNLPATYLGGTGGLFPVRPKLVAALAPILAFHAPYPSSFGASGCSLLTGLPASRAARRSAFIFSCSSADIFFGFSSPSFASATFPSPSGPSGGLGRPVISLIFARISPGSGLSPTQAWATLWSGPTTKTARRA